MIHFNLKLIIALEEIKNTKTMRNTELQIYASTQERLRKTEEEFQMQSKKESPHLQKINKHFQKILFAQC